MSSPDYGMQQEMERERFFTELAICQRIARGTSNEQDALYVASSFGIKNEFQKEINHEQIESNR